MDFHMLWHSKLNYIHTVTAYLLHECIILNFWLTVCIIISLKMISTVSGELVHNQCWNAGRPFLTYSQLLIYSHSLVAQNLKIPFRMHQNLPFKINNQTDFWEGDCFLYKTLPQQVGGHLPTPHLPHRLLHLPPAYFLDHFKHCI